MTKVLRGHEIASKAQYITMSLVDSKSRMGGARHMADSVVKGSDLR